MNPTALQRAERQSVQELPEVDKQTATFNNSDFWSETWGRGEILPDPVTRPGERWLRWYDRQNLNTLWHGTKSGLVKKFGATPYEMKGGRNLTAYFDDVLRYAQFGAGAEALIELLANDYLVFNGGGYMEIIAPGNPLRPPTGRITGLAHLDSYACIPTGNPEYPVVYTDRLGKLHLMHHTRVVHFVDTPDGDQNHPGYGRSALWRAIAICQRQILMGRYVVAALDDKPPPGMMVIGGMTREKFMAATAQYSSTQQMDEKPEWGRTLMLFGVDAEHAPTVQSVPFSAPPEAFDYKVYVELDVHEFALAVGVDIQDLWELTGGQLGSAGQSEVQHAKSRGKTYGEFLASFERAMNNYVLPKSLEFAFKVADPYEAQERATNAQTWASFLQAAGDALTPDEKRQILANQVEAVADAVLDENGELIRLADTDPKDMNQIDALAQDAAPLGVQPATDADVPDTSTAARLHLVAAPQVNRSPSASDTNGMGKETPRPAPLPAAPMVTRNAPVTASVGNPVQQSAPQASPASSTASTDEIVKLMNAGMITIGEAQSRLGIPVDPATAEWYMHNGVPVPKDVLLQLYETQFGRGVDTFTNAVNAPPSNTEAKDYDATRSAFVTDFSDLAQAGLDDDVSRRRAGVVLRAQIARHGRAAYADGLKAGGVEDPLTPDDLNTVTALIAEQSGYVTDFLNGLYTNGVTDVSAHAGMWANKSLQPFFDAGRMSADANGLYVWELGDAEHCASCLKMSGQKHRLKEYTAKGVMPKSDKLECKGFNCACKLVKTSGRSRGGWL